jgi:hypothetical protein
MFEETIIQFINVHRDDNSLQNIMETFNATNIKIEKFHKDKKKNMNRIEMLFEANENHHTIIVNKFMKVMEMMQFITSQINMDIVNILNQMTRIERIIDLQFKNEPQMITIQFESMKESNMNLLNEIKLKNKQNINNFNFDSLHN